MSAVPGKRTEDLPPMQVRRPDQVCDRFEAAWKAGQRPRLEDFLGDTPEAGRPQRFPPQKAPPAPSPGPARAWNRGIENHAGAD
jgi:hypothetical protein